jgi:hypothetical protein
VGRILSRCRRALDDYVLEQTLSAALRAGDRAAVDVLRAEARRRFAGQFGLGPALMGERRDDRGGGTPAPGSRPPSWPSRAAVPPHSTVTPRRDRHGSASRTRTRSGPTSFPHVSRAGSAGATTPWQAIQSAAWQAAPSQSRDLSVSRSRRLDAGTRTQMRRSVTHFKLVLTV